MDEKAIFKLCKDEGCCDACCLRYLGLKHQRVYEHVNEWVAKYSEEPSEETPMPENGVAEPEQAADEAAEGPSAKRARAAACAACLGLLEPQTWPECCRMAKEELDKKGYDCTSFACALSPPLASLLRDKYVLLAIKERFPLFDDGAVPSLKEVWKWSLGARLAAAAARALEPGGAAPLLLSLHYDYPDEAQELAILKAVCPPARSRHRPADLTRRGAELALERATLGDLRALRPPAARARCVAATSRREPIYLGGRYVKLSRQLPQTPWLVRGRRVMDSSVQEIIFEPLAEACGIPAEEAARRLRFVAAGREDVDVRCRGDGRPFAVEIADPRRALTPAELERVCRAISGAAVRVARLVPVTREELEQLKQGEETKSKEYEVLCVKLARTPFDDPAAPLAATAADVARVRRYAAAAAAGGGVRLRQRTPLRVLHRRPLLARERLLLALDAELVPGHPRLLLVRVATSAGTYVKEWVHGELARTAPSLADALGAPADVLALDVTRVALAWPPR